MCYEYNWYDWFKEQRDEWDREMSEIREGGERVLLVFVGSWIQLIEIYKYNLYKYKYNCLNTIDFYHILSIMSILMNRICVAEYYRQNINSHNAIDTIYIYNWYRI